MLKANCKTIYFLYKKCRVDNKRLGNVGLKKILKETDNEAFKEYAMSYGSDILPFFYLNEMILKLFIITPSADKAPWKFEESKYHLYYKYASNMMRAFYPNAAKNLFGQQRIEV